MSAITGIFYRDGTPVTAETLQPSMDALAHYGGDDSAIWTDANTGFGHHLFAITPESKFESLPYSHHGLVITSDARIDNRDELARYLGINLNEQSEIPDSHLILLAYEKWGQDCTQHLLGDFAFVIRDEARRELFCARDHIGARPFYYYDDGNIFAFATEIKGLLAYSDVPAEIDDGEIALYLTEGNVAYYHRTRTFFRNIHKLPFAHQMIVNDAGVNISAHWNPGNEPELKLGTEDEYAEMMLELLSDAVACRIRTKREIGSHLSGGFDSSAIAVEAARQLRTQGRQLHTYSWSPPLTAEDNQPDFEQHRINAICEQEGLECRYLERTARDQIHMLWVDLATTPFVSSAVERALQRQMKADGVQVVLTGWGGDEGVSFNGRGYSSDLLMTGRWLELLSMFPSRRKIYSPLRYAGIARRIWRSAVIPLMPESLYRQFSPLGEVIRPTVNFMQRDFADRMAGKTNNPEPLRRSIRGIHPYQIARLQDGHLTSRIDSWSALSARSGMIYSYPLLDKRLMEFAYRIPDDLFYRHQQDRYIFRLAIEKLISPELAWADAKAEPSNLGHHNRLGDEAYQTQLRAFFDQSKGKDENPWVDVQALDNAINHFVDLADENVGAFLCALQCLTIWEHQNTRLGNVEIS